MKKKILVVDNENDQLNIIRQILERQDFAVRVAESGSGALDVLEKDSFHMVITDLIMPDMEGTDLCEQVRRWSPKTLVLAISGHIGLYDPKKLKAAGFDGFIEKPIDIKSLLGAVSNAFQCARG